MPSGIEEWLLGNVRRMSACCRSLDQSIWPVDTISQWAVCGMLAACHDTCSVLTDEPCRYAVSWNVLRLGSGRALARTRQTTECLSSWTSVVVETAECASHGCGDVCWAVVFCMRYTVTFCFCFKASCLPPEFVRLCFGSKVVWF